MKFIASVAIVLLTVHQGASQEAPRVRFAWPTGVEARVETEYVSEAGIDQVTQQISRLRMSHRMRVLPYAGGRQVLQTDQTHLESSGEVMQAVGALLSLWVPTSIVSEQGEFKTIEGAAQLRELVTAMVEPRLREAEQIPQFKAFLTYMTTEEALVQLARTEWEDLAGRWVGMGTAPQRIEDSGTAPVAPGITVPTKVTVSTIESPPCSRGGAEYQCVTYEYRSRIDREGAAAVFEALLKGAVPPVRREVTDLEIVHRVTLETRTMLPHEVTVMRTMHGEVELNGRMVETSSSEQRRSQVTYIAN